VLSKIKNDREEIKMADMDSIPIKKKSSIFEKLLKKFPKLLALSRPTNSNKKAPQDDEMV
jgi:hypothetical protein